MRVPAFKHQVCRSDAHLRQLGWAHAEAAARARRAVRRPSRSAYPPTHPPIHPPLHSSLHPPICISPPAAATRPTAARPAAARPAATGSAAARPAAAQATVGCPTAGCSAPLCRRLRRRLLCAACTFCLGSLTPPRARCRPTLHPARCGRRQGHRLRLQSEVRRITSHLTVSGVLTGTPRSPPYEPVACGADARGADDFATQPPLGAPPAATEGGAQQVCEELAKLERALRPARAAPPPVEACPSVSHTRASVADELSRISHFLQASSSS